ncbi:MAG: hypothetical protein JWM27_2308 [Gemmatimonadetes bacterium]|nr:hypothetical protein [Gemmatimonadota bacterium]
MCGIAGMVMERDGVVDGSLVESLLRRLEHRGPDDRGWLAWSREGVRRGRQVPGHVPAEVLLVHRRLSILDLSEAGWQPMSTPDGRYHVTFNGEIYNFVELRERLSALGHEFRSHSDTEVLLAAFAQWGPAALNELVGMFALALLDTRDRTLLLARDFFGIKPLYFARWKGGLAFASEVKALLELPGVDRNVDAQSLYDYLRLGLSDSGRSGGLLQGVVQLPPAHYAVIDLDAPALPEPVRYWSLSGVPRVELSFGDAADRLRALFLDSIRLHLRSDVPVGAALSGGIDSSSIVMAMRELEPKLEIHTFSFIPDDERISEERWIDVVSKAAGTVQHKVRPGPEDLAADLGYLIDAQDLPFASTSMYAQHRVFRLAHEAGIKVVLDGQGADEMLGGYAVFAAARLAALLRAGRMGEAYAFARGAARLPGGRGIARSLGQFLVPAGAQAPLRYLAGERLMPGWMNRQWFTSRVPVRPLQRGRGAAALKEELVRSVTDTSLPALLRYEDRNSMAFSVESRVPFLTPQLAEFILGLPDEYLIAPDATSKAVFRRAMRGLVPDVVLDRKDKVGFATPEQRWLSALDPWVRDVIGRGTGHPVFAAGMLAAEWDAIRGGRKRFDFRLWRCLNFILWAENSAATFN